MVEKLCGNCTKFVVDERGLPDGIKQISKRLFWNEDGTQREMTALEFTVAMQTSGLASYGHKFCELSGHSATFSSSPCTDPESFEEKK